MMDEIRLEQAAPDDPAAAHFSKLWKKQAQQRYFLEHGIESANADEIQKNQKNIEKM